MLIVKLGILAILVVGLFGGCEGTCARQFGGTMTINLPPDQKLINVTWKDDDAWYLIRPMHSDETPETYRFEERSNFNILEGTIVVNETTKEKP